MTLLRTLVDQCWSPSSCLGSTGHIPRMQLLDNVAEYHVFMFRFETSSQGHVFSPRWNQPAMNRGPWAFLGVPGDEGRGVASVSASCSQVPDPTTSLHFSTLTVGRVAPFSQTPDSTAQRLPGGTF